MPYCGAGPDSRKTGRSDYRIEDTNVDVHPGVRIYKGLRATAIGSFLAVNTGPGRSTRYASTDNQFGPNVASGIDRQTNFWRGGGLVEYDWRDHPGGATSGGRYGRSMSDTWTRSSVHTASFGWIWMPCSIYHSLTARV